MALETQKALMYLVGQYADGLNLLMLKHEAEIPRAFKDEYLELVRLWFPQFEAKLAILEAERVADGIQD